jgi:signal transduction histidine kinase
MSGVAVFGSRARRPLSLQARLLGLIIISTVVAGAVAGGLVFIILSRNELATWATRQRDAMNAAATLITNFNQRVDDEVRFLPVLEGDQDIITGINLASAILALNPAYSEVVIVQNDGTIVQSAQRSTNFLSNVFTLSQSRWFTALRDNIADENLQDGVYISPLQITAESDIYLVRAVRFNPDVIIGVALDMRFLSDTVSASRFSETGRAYLVKTDGTLIAHTDLTLVQRGVNLADDPTFQRAVATDATTDITQYTNFQGDDVFGLSERIPGTDWWLFTEVDSDEVLANVRLFGTGLLLSVIGGGSIIAILLGALIRRGIIRPLRALQGGATQIAAGNLGYQVQIYNQDEIGEVASQFNDMSTQLAARAAEREQLIKDLQFAKRLADENSRLKSEFLSTMSHELRTPLNAIEGFTSIMLGGMGIELSPRAEDMVRRVSGNSKRLLQLVNDFLDLSRIESGRLELIDTPVSAAELAMRWSRSVSVLGEEKGIAYHVDIDPNLPYPLLLDEDAVTKVAINLLSNAFKFTHQGEVTLTLRRAGDSHWELCVRDTGIGIPPHAHEYIFEEFRQVDGSSKRLYGGTGLGLSLVQKLVRLMNGTVTLESEVGHGSTFTVTLPLKTSQAEMMMTQERTTA